MRCVLALAAVAFFSPAAVRAQAHPNLDAGPELITVEPDLNADVRLMYELKFSESRERLAAWQMQHPADPMGSALEAAAYLFEELYEKGVLSSDFFLDDKRLLGGIEGRPDPALEASFFLASQRAEDQARLRLADSPRDANALLALTMVAGMRSDNSGLIEKRGLETISLLREADHRARALLDVAPDAADAYIALGAANYIVGCMPTYKRWLLRLGGVPGDRALGMQELTLAASGGHYLRPFAQVLLALAALREKDVDLARRELVDLNAQFPGNSLFARELAKLRPGVPASR